VLTESELLAAVDGAFAVTGRGLRRWADPHPDRSPRDEEYSRLLDPAKWRILGARVDAWMVALVDATLAVVERGRDASWLNPPGAQITRTDRVVPFAVHALPLTVGRSRLGNVGDAGVTLGVGEPAVRVAIFPDCGCDACDSGSQNELDHLDAHLRSIVTGAFRRLSSGARTITTRGDGGWSARGRFGRREVERILAGPNRWPELSGSSWLGPA
jgi:hypothetical protein